jgi:acetyl-CoA C-acetyltransferase
LESRVANEAFIVDAIRSPIGKRNGGLSALHPADLGGEILRALVERTGIDPVQVDDVIYGCVSQIGAQASNVGRTAWLAADLPETVPATTVDRQCGSSLQALAFAAQGVMAGSYELAIAGGVEVMSKVPIMSPGKVGAEAGLGRPSEAAGWQKRFGDQEISQFRGAELIADRWEISRAAMEEFALRSHELAAAAWDKGHFDREVIPVAGVDVDEGFRREASLQAMQKLKPIPGREKLTAAVASQVSDGASAALVASGEAVKKYGLTPRARIHSLAVVGDDPVYMLTGPIPATRRVLDRAGLSLADIDRFEVNEAFASVVLAWAAETGAPLEKTNVNGGAIALGHPLGATGTKLTAALLGELERSGGRYGLLAICEGGGTANAAILERV